MDYESKAVYTSGLSRSFNRQIASPLFAYRL